MPCSPSIIKNFMFREDNPSSLLKIVSYSIHFYWIQNDISTLELLVHSTIGKSTPADTNALKHTIASELVENKFRIQKSGSFLFVWYNATNKMGICLIQGCQQLLQLTLERR